MTESLNNVRRQIRRVLSRPGSCTVDELTDLADHYRKLVEEVNERIDRAHVWLHNGLRSEALGLIEQQQIGRASCRERV